MKVTFFPIFKNNNYSFKINKSNKLENNKNQNSQLSDSYSALINKSLISFGAKQKSSFSSEVEKLLDKGDENELFEYISSQLRKKAQEKKIDTNIIDDVIQNAIVEILLLFQDFSDDKLSKKELLDKINAIYKNIKPKKDDYVSEKRPLNLNQNSEIVYPFEFDETKTRVNSALDGVELSNKEKDVLARRFNDEGKQSFDSIANYNNVSGQTIKNIFKRAICKIQIKNNTLPDDIKQNILDTVELFKDEGLTYEEFLKACLKEPYLFTQPPKDSEKKLEI